MTLSISYSRKNFRAAHYVLGFSRLFLPSSPQLRKLEKRLAALTSAERETVSDRGDYYLRLNRSFDATDGIAIRQFREEKVHRVKTTYFLDLYKSLRHFDRTLKFQSGPADLSQGA